LPDAVGWNDPGVRAIDLAVAVLVIASCGGSAQCGAELRRLRGRMRIELARCLAKARLD
jgi:hypothetical protein